MASVWESSSQKNSGQPGDWDSTPPQQEAAQRKWYSRQLTKRPPQQEAAQRKNESVEVFPFWWETLNTRHDWNEKISGLMVFWLLIRGPMVRGLVWESSSQKKFRRWIATGDSTWAKVVSKKFFPAALRAAGRTPRTRRPGYESAKKFFPAALRAAGRSDGGRAADARAARACG